MRTKIPGSTLRRLEALEKRYDVVRPVAMWVKILPVDEWGSIAANMQAELKSNVKKDGAPSYDPKDISRLVLISSE